MNDNEWLFYPAGNRISKFYGNLDRLRAHLVFKGVYEIEEWRLIEWVHRKENRCLYFIFGCAHVLDNVKEERIREEVGRRLNKFTFRKSTLDDDLRRININPRDLPGTQEVAPKIIHIAKECYRRSKNSRNVRGNLHQYVELGEYGYAMRASLNLLKRVI